MAREAPRAIPLAHPASPSHDRLNPTKQNVKKSFVTGRAQSRGPRISIRNGRLIDPANGVDRDADLHIAAGRVVAVGAAPAGFQPDQTIDARGHIVCPGFIDLSVRLREPGLEHKATIATETAAAAAGGITTLCCPPDTDPVIDTPAVAQLVHQIAERVGAARVLPAAALTQDLDGDQISEMAALKAAGCPVLSHGSRPLHDPLFKRQALEYASTFGMTVFLVPEDDVLRHGGCAHEGRVATRLGLPGIPVAAETVAVAQDLALAEQTGARIHFRGLSTVRATEKLAEAQGRSIPVSADVAVHQLFLTEDDLLGFDSNCHVLPPLRTQSDRDGLRAAVASGSIIAITSDHQPHDADSKLAPFPETAPGISGLETLLPLVLRLVDQGVLAISSAIDRLTAGPAGVLGESLGHLGEGATADVCVFDPDQIWIPSAATLRSSGLNSPFLGQEMRGRVSWTLLAGEIVFQRKGEKQ